MPITCVGLSHRTASLAVRERLAVGRDELRAVLSEQLAPGLRAQGVAELSLVSTCNRTEVYAAASAGSAVATRDLLSDHLLRSRGLDATEPGIALYSHAGDQALRHLCRVAAGLDSMIIGEAEVLGQVASAYQSATEAGTAGPILAEAFRTALRAGRRARVETGICRSAMSVASEAVRLVGELAAPETPVLLVGTGAVARVLGEVLRSQGFAHLTVVGRTAERSRTVASSLGASSRPWHVLRDALGEAEVVVTSTAAPHTVITRELVESAIAARDPARSLSFVDVAVPRDVDSTIASLPGVRVFDLDTLQGRLNGNLAERRRAVPVRSVRQTGLDHFRKTGLGRHPHRQPGAARRGPQLRDPGLVHRPAQLWQRDERALRPRDDAEFRIRCGDVDRR